MLSLSFLFCTMGLWQNCPNEEMRNDYRLAISILS